MPAVCRIVYTLSSMHLQGVGNNIVNWDNAAEDETTAVIAPDGDGALETPAESTWDSLGFGNALQRVRSVIVSILVALSRPMLFGMLDLCCLTCCLTA